MKKITALLLILVSVFMLTSCSAKGDYTVDFSKSEIYSQKDMESDYTVDFGKSEIYSQKDMESALSEIFKEFDSWKGKNKMYKIAYCGDEKSKANLDYINELANAQGKTAFDECIVFTCDFHSAWNASEGFTPNEDFYDWTWYLGRTNGSKWTIMTYGVC